jgi:hypothetical protein
LHFINTQMFLLLFLIKLAVSFGKKKILSVHALLDSVKEQKRDEGKQGGGGTRSVILKLTKSPSRGHTQVYHCSVLNTGPFQTRRHFLTITSVSASDEIKFYMRSSTTRMSQNMGNRHPTCLHGTLTQYRHSPTHG